MHKVKYWYLVYCTAPFHPEIIHLLNLNQWSIETPAEDIYMVDSQNFSAMLAFFAF